VFSSSVRYVRPLPAAASFPLLPVPSSSNHTEEIKTDIKYQIQNHLSWSSTNATTLILEMIKSSKKNQMSYLFYLFIFLFMSSTTLTLPLIDCLSHFHLPYLLCITTSTSLTVSMPYRLAHPFFFIMLYRLSHPLFLPNLLCAVSPTSLSYLI
jgi:hypothetical protein